MQRASHTALTGIGLSGFRCFDSTELSPDAEINLISGDNASGKTSLLEAIYFLGRGRSFRESQRRALVESGREACRVTGELESVGRGRVRLGMEYGSGGARGRVNGRPARGMADLARLVPVQVIGPQSHELVEGAPAIRRRYMDWGAFHVEQRFSEAYRDFQKALRQRNAALRAGERKAARAWDPELVRAGREIARMREGYVESLGDPVRGTVAAIMGGEGPELEYLPGLDGYGDLEEALEGSIGRDCAAGFTTVGPHRGDMAIRLGGADARMIVSRGQEKVLAACLVLGQMALHGERMGDGGVLLVDDVSAELGPAYLDRLLGVLAGLDAQRFVTSTDPDALEGFARAGAAPAKRFHVEHGSVREVLP